MDLDDQDTEYTRRLHTDKKCNIKDKIIDLIKDKIKEYKEEMKNCFLYNEIGCKECNENCSFNDIIEVLEKILKEV